MTPDMPTFHKEGMKQHTASLIVDRSASDTVHLAAIRPSIPSVHTSQQR